MPGTLYLLTGLPFSGQKTLLASLRTKLNESPTFGILEPLITQEEMRTHESQVVCTEDEFKAHTDNGAFLTNWKSQGYLVSDITEILTQKLKVVFRVPRDKLAEVEKKATEIEGVSVVVVDLVVSQDVLVERATAAAEDDKFNDKAFIKKIKAIPEAKGETIKQVDFEGEVEQALEGMLEALGFDSLTDLPPSDEEGQLNLATCSAQDYLKHVLYPHLAPALERITVERPADPVEFLALYLKKSAGTTRERIKELTELKAVKTRLRAEKSSELTMVGRV